MTGRPSVVLWAPAASTFPSAPTFRESLTTPLVASLIGAAATRINYAS